MSNRAKRLILNKIINQSRVCTSSELQNYNSHIILYRIAFKSHLITLKKKMFIRLK